MSTIATLAAAYRAKTTTPTIEIERVFATIKAKDASIHAFLETYEAEALALAAAATAAPAAPAGVFARPGIGGDVRTHG